ncbi:MAG TPA: glycosyltransferase family 4 protein [Pyrinomonadaceae bacterium]
MKRKPPLLLVANFLSSNGGRRSVMEDLAERLRQAKYDLVTASPYRKGWVRGAHMVAMAIIRRRDYEVTVVDLYSGRAFLWAEGVCGALRMIGKTFVLTLRGGNLPAFAQRQPKRVRRLLRSAAAVTTPSHYLLEEMKPYGDSLLLLPNPLDLDIYQFKQREQPQATLTWLRAFHATYNPGLAPKVVALLAQDFPDISLTMVGPDKGDGSLQHTVKVASELGVADRATFPGGVYKTEVPEWLNKADIFLNTTNVDNTPVSVLEAMACGLCVVSTNAGGIPYLLEDEHDALLVPPDDPEAMAAAVRRLLTEEGLAERISRNARQKVEQFDWSIILPQWETLLARVAPI